MGFVTINEGINKSIGTNSKDLLYIQRFIRDTYKLTLENMLDSTNLNGAESFVMNCSEYDMVFFKILFSVSNASAKFRIKLYDLNDVYTYSEQYTISSTGILEDSLYVGELLVADVRGFNKVAIRLDSDITNGGNVKILGGGMGNDVIINFSYILGGNDGSDKLKCNDKYNNQNDSWESKTNLLSPQRTHASGLNILNKGYIVYGYDGTNQLKDTDEYFNDIWTSKTDGLSPARSECLLTSILNKGYVSFGTDGTNQLKDTDEYFNDIWTSKTDGLSPARQTHIGLFILNSGYVIGGTPGPIKNNDEYIVDTWTNKNDSPSPGRYHLTGNFIINKGYIIYGYDGISWGIFLKNNDEYDKGINSWISKTDALSPSRISLTATNIQNKIYTFYGYDDSSPRIKDCNEYMVDTWTQKSDGLSPARDTRTSFIL